MFKKLLHSYMVLVIVLGLFPVQAFALPAGESLPHAVSGSSESADVWPEEQPAFERLPEGSYVEGELLVVYEGEEVRSVDASDAEEALVASVEDVVDAQCITKVQDAEDDAILKVEVSEEADLQETAQELSELPEVLYVQPNYTYELFASGASSSPDDPRLASQYYLKDHAQYGAGVLKAWEKKKSNKSVTVAVLDTGMWVERNASTGRDDVVHEDLKANVLTSYMYDAYYGTTEGFISSYANPTGYSEGHGIHVAGIIAATANNALGIAGVSYNANIIPIKVFPNSGDSNTAVLVRAYNYLFSLVDDGKVGDLHVINLSMGGYGSMDSDDMALERIINRAKDNYNIVTVCAGGNGDGVNPLTERVLPGDLDACVSVTALDKNGNNWASSDYNRYKDISAPGVGITSTWISSRSSYLDKNGTSMATPIVSGIFALLWAENPALTVDQACEAIYNTAHPLNPNAANYHPESGSHGAIDAAAALDYVRAEKWKGVSSGGATNSSSPSAGQGSNSNANTTGSGSGVTVSPKPVWYRLDGTLNGGKLGNRYDTMQDILREGWPSRTGGSVVIATGNNFKDALSAAGLAGRLGAPVLLTDGKALSAQTRAELIRLRPKNVYIAGGTAAIAASVATQIRSITGVAPMRVYGQTSSGTSAALALRARGRWKDHTAIIATNKSFKDALSAAPVAYAKGYPILLADNGTKLSTEVLSALKSCGITQVIIVGGPVAVTKSVETQLTRAGVRIKTRLYGQTGIKTSAAIAKWALNNGMRADGMGVATSQNYADAVSGAAFCGSNNTVLLLADDKALANASFPKAYKANMKRGYVFGGEFAVGKTTWNTLVKSTA